jgi:hypothetical protein
LLTGKRASRKLLPKEIVSSSEAQGSADSSRSAGDKVVRPDTLPNVPEQIFTQRQDEALNLPAEVPLRLTRQEIGREVGVDTCSGHINSHWHRSKEIKRTVSSGGYTCGRARFRLMLRLDSLSKEGTAIGWLTRR